MWLGLYQSASIWLCVGPDLAPQVDRAAGADRRAGRTPSRIAAASDEHGKERERAGGGAAGGQSSAMARRAARRLPSAPLLRTTRPCCACLVPNATPMPVDAGKLDRAARGRDLDRPARTDPRRRSARRETGRDQHPDARGIGRDRAVEPALPAQRRRLHDHVGAPRHRRRPAGQRPDRLHPDRQASRHGALHRPQAVRHLRRASSMPSPTSRATRGRCSSACSTRSSTGWPTNSKSPGAKSRRSRARSSTITPTARVRNPELRLEAMLMRIGKAQQLLAKLRETSVSTTRLLTFLASIDAMDERHRQPPPRRKPDRRRQCAQRPQQFPRRQSDLPARRLARADQPRAE